jgi:hypothetical protein
LRGKSPVGFSALFVRVCANDAFDLRSGEDRQRFSGDESGKNRNASSSPDSLRQR